MMHAVPPMGPLDVMKGSPLCDQQGWVDVNKETLQHVKYCEPAPTYHFNNWLIQSPFPRPLHVANVFAIGDCTNIPTSRTAAACAAQAAVLRHNLFSVIKGAELTAKVPLCYPLQYFWFQSSVPRSMMATLPALSSLGMERPS